MAPSTLSPLCGIPQDTPWAAWSPTARICAGDWDRGPGCPGLPPSQGWKATWLLRSHRTVRPMIPSRWHSDSPASAHLTQALPLGPAWRLFLLLLPAHLPQQLPAFPGDPISARMVYIKGQLSKHRFTGSGRNSPAKAGTHSSCDCQQGRGMRQENQHVWMAWPRCRKDPHSVRPQHQKPRTALTAVGVGVRSRAHLALKQRVLPLRAPASQKPPS